MSRERDQFPPGVLFSVQNHFQTINAVSVYYKVPRYISLSLINIQMPHTNCLRNIHIPNFRFCLYGLYTRPPFSLSYSLNNNYKI